MVKVLFFIMVGSQKSKIGFHLGSKEICKTCENNDRSLNFTRIKY